jgi:hypothetical protein
VTPPAIGHSDAAYHGHAPVVSTLLDFHSPLCLPFGDRSYEDSPLCVAAKEGHLEVVSVLLNRGASVRQKDELGWPPIRYAAHHGHPEVLELLLTQATTLSSDEDETGASGFDHIAEHGSVDFSVTSNISDERKGRVRELLSQAEGKVNAFMAERTMRAATPTPLFADGYGSQRAELDPMYHPQEMATNLASSGVFRSRTTLAPPPQKVNGNSNPPRYQAYTPQAFNDTKIDPYVSRPNSTTSLSDSAETPVPAISSQPPSRSNSTLYRSSSLRMFSPPSTLSPEEAALLIEDRRNEIAQLQLFLPSIDEAGGSGYGVREYYAPVPTAPTAMVHELPSDWM